MAPPARTQQNRDIAVATPAGEDVLLLKNMKVEEGLSRLFSVELEMVSDRHDIAYKDMLGKGCTARITIGSKDDPANRYFNGIVSRFVQEGGGGAMATYRATLVPWTWMLTRYADCRIFQKKNVPDIVQQIFRDRGFSDFEVKLSGAYKEWEYCVQYRETDFEFISRLMEQEGIYYYFRHENGKHVMVLLDDSKHHTSFPWYETIEYRPPDQTMQDREFITAWSLEQQLVPAQYSLGDFNWIKQTPVLTSTLKTTAASPVPGSEVYDYPGEYEEEKEGEALVKVRMQELESRFEVAAGAGDSRGIVVGKKFTLAEYTREDQNKDYLVTHSTLEAQSDSYESGGDTGEASVRVSFGCIPATQQFRPPRTTPRPEISGCQTAVVVGPAGEEIWTDEHARVKVMFHWDREAAADEESSCWIRVAQQWAGKGSGFTQIPRIGQEVIVEFLEGDPDRPIIVGRVFNAANKPPYKLPDHNAKFSIKTLTTPGGGGFNEIRFEDKKSEEQIFIHAQRNIDVRVGTNAYRWIGANDHTIIEKDQVEHVKQDRQVLIDRDHKEKVLRDRSLKVEGKQAEEIVDSLSLKVGGNVIEEFGADASMKVADQLSIQAKTIVLDASENITLKVGKTSISIEKDSILIDIDGKLEIKAKDEIHEKTKKWTVKTDTDATIDAKDATVKASGDVMIKGSKVTVQASGPATLKGATVAIN